MDNTPRSDGAQLQTAPYTLHPFSAENLYLLLNKSQHQNSDTPLEDRAGYLHTYLSELKANTILVEYMYTDGDYLDDYASYYVRCFRDYDRHCRRLHFFSISFSEAEFIEIVERGREEETKRLKEAYLGFVVVRPLPESTVGRTVLKTYAPDGGRRSFPCVREYRANLFGIDLSVRSLAYQEQDSVLAACATVSLWSCFNKTKELFGSTSPSPAEITRAATNVIYFSRSTPASGLKVQQICSAIKHVGLEPEVIHVTKDVPLVALIYSYVRMGMPVILGVDIENRGPHALTIVGYSLLENRPPYAEEILKKTYEEDKEGIPTIGLRIDRLYSHDDQIGPFSRLWVQPSDKDDYPIAFKGSWRDQESNPLSLYPRVVILPIYHKIRVTFIDVHKWLTPLSAVFSRILGNETQLEWDIYLTTTSDYKTELRKNSKIQGNTLRELLLEQHPRFIWRVVLRSDGKEVVEFLIDATDIASSVPFYRALWFNEGFKNDLKVLLEEPEYYTSWISMLKHRLWEFLKANT